jgi:hypothetical protein
MDRNNKAIRNEWRVRVDGLKERLPTGEVLSFAVGLREMERWRSPIIFRRGDE